MSEKLTYPDGSTPTICIIGAGISGLCAGIQLKEQLGLTTFNLYESNKDVGGTWLTNTYPGCACDIPSHLYSFSFERNPDWSEHYPSQPEIWNYIKSVTDKYDLYSHIKFETQVKSAAWIESTKKWKVVTLKMNSNKETTDIFDLVIMCVGGLRVPNVPEEFLSFKGPLIHSAEWNPSIELRNKVVGIVGSGASAVQIIPEIVKDVKELHVYQRKPAWVMPRPQWKFPGWLKTLFFYLPILTWLLRALIFIRNEITHLIVFKNDSFLKKFGLGQKLARHHIKKQIPGNEKLRKELTPNYTLGCKRIAPSKDYYPAMAQPNVTLHRSLITKVKGHGIETNDGHLQNLDVLILATGYRVHDYFAPMEMYGRNNENIMESFLKMPESYYGIVSNSTPNSFVILGPNTGLGHNTAVFMIECQVNFTINMIREMMLRNAKTSIVKKSAQDEFMNWIMNGLKNTVWGTEKCGSWYANKAGVITTLWPENCISYWRKTRKINWSHFDFE